MLLEREELRMQFNQLRRREFITLLGGAVVVWPLTTRAQTGAIPVIGFLGSASLTGNAQLVGAFQQGLNETGHTEGRNVRIEYRWAEGRYAEVPHLAADLIRRNVAVLYAFDNTATAQAAKAASSTTPVVFSIGADPVKFGLVASLNHPGGNVTGVVSLTVGLGVKRLQILRELAPNSIALLVNPNNPVSKFESTEVQGAAKAVGQTLIVVNASSENEIDAAFASIAQQRIDAVLIQSEPFFTSRTQQIASLAARYDLPAIDAYREFVLAGGLMSYGASLAEARRQAGIYVGRILKGEKPADLPVVQSTKIELVINLKIAKTLGLTLPTALLVRADKVIE
jgi:putative ABC transport system substrate-binding protein